MVSVKITAYSKKQRYIAVAVAVVLLVASACCIAYVYTRSNKQSPNSSTGPKKDTEAIRKNLPPAVPVYTKSTPRQGGDTTEYLRLYQLAVQQRQANPAQAKQYATQALNISINFTNDQIATIEDITAKETILYDIRSVQ